ncbi:MAG: ampG [Gammaproteobacteria bacterium]|jgi:PAT family beta-lactamase induction signal transducer AmpG|nr:ampG [Gammaproteobacteria bacterium]
MLLLGFSSGLPIALTSSTLQAWYTVSGVSIVTIGFLTLVGQPYAFKFIWSPIMDRYVPPLFGRRRGWILITQIALLLTIGLMAQFDPKVQPTTLAVIAFIIAFLSASQDISLDAYRADILSSEERGAGSALWISGYRIAVLVSGGAALIVAAYIGWRVTLLGVAGLMLIGMITTLFAETPAQDAAHPLSLRDAMIEPFKDFFTRPAFIAILFFIIFYKLPDSFAMSLSTAFYLRGMGFSLLELGTTMKTMSLLGTIVGAIAGGLLTVRLGLYRSLMVFGIFQAATNGLYILLIEVGKNYFVFSTSVFIENFSSGMGSTAFLSFLMALCHERYTATQFALLSSLTALGRVFVGPVAGFIVAAVGWRVFFLWSIVAAIPGLWLLYYLRDRLNFSAERLG